MGYRIENDEILKVWAAFEDYYVEINIIDLLKNIKKIRPELLVKAGIMQKIHEDEDNQNHERSGY